jgi:hypothetical protein
MTLRLASLAQGWLDSTRLRAREWFSGALAHYKTIYILRHPLDFYGIGAPMISP